MKTAAGIVTLFLMALICSGLAQAQISSFQHIVLIVQENRTPDNLFQGLCLAPYGSPNACGTGPNQYNIQSYGFDKKGTQIPLQAVPLSNTYDPGHGHAAFETMCNPNTTTHYPCRVNTALPISGCTQNESTSLCSFQYVDPNPAVTPSLGSYLYIAQNFGWANTMYQTNQGPSAPAHQFLFGGTSAPSASDDAQATFVAENPSGLGCLAPLNAVYNLIDPATAPKEYDLINNPLGTVCFSHDTLANELENDGNNDGNGNTWRYYATGTEATHVSNNIWTAPNWIYDICQPNSGYTKCLGSDWIDNVYLLPSQVLKDSVSPTCDLKNMVWVTPIGQNSDHPSSTGTHVGGPLWVASIINAINGSSCTDTINGVAVPYWQDTAIVVVWDDWGGWYDHVLPQFLSAPKEGQGDYQLGFRVPLLFVSAYTPHLIDSTNQYDFGSVLRFAEHNFGIPEGVMGFADARSTSDLTAFYNLSLTPTQFPIPTYGSSVVVDDTLAPDPPDDD
jgi:phospholipase C